MGDVIGDVNSRRGRIDEMEDLQGGAAKLIKAFCPLLTLRLYHDLRGYDSRSCSFHYGNYGYEEVPPNVAQEGSKTRS